MKYWAYINNEILGPFEKEELIKLPQFNNSTLLCPQSPVGEKTQDWKEAASFPEISALISEGGAKNISSGFENFGNIEIKNVDSSSFSSPAQRPSQLDPISLSQISRRQQDFSEPPKKEPQPIEEKKEIPQTQKNEKNFLSTSNSSNLSEIDLSALDPSKEMPPEDAGQALELPQIETPASIEPFSLAKEEVQLPQMQPSEQISEANETNVPQEITPQEEIKSEEPAQVEMPKEISLEMPQQTNETEEVKPEISNEIQIPKLEEHLKPENFLSEENSIPQIGKSGGSFQDSEKMISLLEKFAGNSATKEDINLLKTYLEQKIDSVSNKINIPDNSDIKLSLKNIENKMNSLESKIDRIKPEDYKPAAKTESLTIDHNYDSEQIKQVESTRTKAAIQSPAKPEIKQAETSKQAPPPAQNNEAPKEEKKKLNIMGMIKPVFKAIGAAIMIVGTIIALTFALKHAGVVDLTGYIPMLPKKEKTVKQKPAQGNMFEQSSSTSAVSQTVFTDTATAQAQEQSKPADKNISDEVIYFTRLYIKEGNEKNLENLIIEDATVKKLNPVSMVWKGSKIKDNTYLISADFKEGEQTKSYSFEVDYSQKVLNAASDLAKELFSVKKPAIEKKKPVKAKKTTVKKPATKSAPKAVEKPKEAAPKKEDEYEYEYDEDEGEQEYLLPGIPKK